MAHDNAVAPEGITLDVHYHPSAPAEKAVFTSPNSNQRYLRPRCSEFRSGQVVEVTSNHDLVKCEACQAIAQNEAVDAEVRRLKAARR